MYPLIHNDKTKRVLIVSVFVLFMLPVLASGKNIVATEAVETSKLQLTAGKSLLLQTALPIKRVSVANPQIADFLLLSPSEIYLTGKEAGTTNLTFWQDKKVVAIYDIEVAYDISELKQQLHNFLPDENNLRVVAAKNSIILSGKISSAANLSQAVALARSYAPEEQINNLLEVGGIHQVMLEVRVAEMSRALTKRLGINFAYQKGDKFAVSLLSGLGSFSPLTGNLLGVSPAVTSLFRFETGSATWTGVLDALREDNLVKILAEPTLITLSGQSANFLAGGEFPVPVPQGLGTVGIEYKPFGVALIFTPTVLSKDKIAVEVTPEVSELDFSTAILVEGFVTPGIRTRRASTKVELADGQSFAIAGLLSETVLADVSKFPLLGDLPVIGALFQSKSFQKRESELVIIVTPHLVKPLDLAKQSLPTDSYVEPTDFEFYFHGAIEGKKSRHAVDTHQGLDGKFGHSMPEE
jgi:pilus assembly protein CpaC